MNKEDQVPMASIEVSFSKEQSALIVSVFSNVRGPSAAVIQLSNLMKKVKASAEVKQMFFLNEIGCITATLSKYDSYSIADGNILPGLSDLLQAIISKLEEYSAEVNTIKEEPREEEKSV